MKFLLAIMCVGIGGAFGALGRSYSMMLLKDVIGLNEYPALMIVNVFGCFMIGTALMWIEGSFRRDGTSRLKHLNLVTALKNCDWWPDGDPTIPLSDTFNLNLSAQMMSAFVTTGFIGTYTTFSDFSLLSVHLADQGLWIDLTLHIVGSLVLGYLAVLGGILMGQHIVLR